MKVKRNNRFLILSLSIVVVILILLIAVVLLNYTQAGKIGKSFIEVSDQLNTVPETLIDVIHYDINIELIPADKLIKGEVEIMLEVTDDIDEVELNFYDNFDIYEVLVNGEPGDYEYADNKLIMARDLFTKNRNTLQISYSGTPKSEGLGSFTFGSYKDKSFIYTLNEPVFAATWLPCNDNLNDKATLDISITNDSSMVSVSNGRLVDIRTEGSKKTYSYSTDYLISTYLIAIYSADYRKFSDTYTSLDKNRTMPVNYYVTADKLAEAEKDFLIHPGAISILAELFGEYPFMNDGYGVAQFLWKYGAMEHQTITGIGSDFISGHRFHTGMLVHEIAHHWWGNAVTPKSWKDIWLNEGFATYSEALYWEKKTGKRSLRSTMRGYFDSFEQSTLYNPGINIFSRLVYEKGAWVLHMLRREVGDDVFFDILRNYFESYKYKNADTENFVDVCETVSGRELDYFFEQWVYEGTGILEINYKYKVKDDNNMYLSLSQVQNDKTVYNYLLDLEINYRNGTSEIIESRISTTDTTLVIPLADSLRNVILDPNDWLLASVFEDSR